MIEVIVMSCVMIILLLILNAVVCSIAGVGSAGELGKVMEGTITIVFLYMLIIGLFGASLDLEGLPFVDRLDEYESISYMFHNSLSDFIIECTELVSLTFVISYISNIIPSGFGGSNYTGKIIRSVVIVLVGVIANNYLITVAKQTVFFEWGVMAVQCMITGAALTITPAAMLGKLLSVSPDHAMVKFLLNELPKTSVGKALSTAATNSITMVFVIIIFESQFGSLPNVLGQLPSLIYIAAPIVIMLIGIKIMIKSVTK